MFQKLYLEWIDTLPFDVFKKLEESHIKYLIMFATWLDTRGRTTHETDTGHDGALQKCKICGSTEHHIDEDGNYIQHAPS